MPMLRGGVTVGGLMAAIALLGVEFAALRAGSPLWFSAIYTLTVVLLLLAILAARFRRADAGAFWFGFALFGWAFLLLTLGPWSSPHIRDDQAGYDKFNPNLVTTRLLVLSLHRIRGSTDDYEVIDEFAYCTMGLAQLMLTLILSIAGGWVAVLLRNRRNRARLTGPRPPRLRTATLLSLGGLILILLVGSRTLPRRSEPVYFPELVFHREPERNELVVDWYTKHLRAMAESSLWERAQGGGRAAVYRLLWLPSFNHPACVRITRSARGATLRVVVLDGLGGYEPGQIAIDRTVRLSESDWNEIEQQLAELEFWSLSTELEDDGGSDGDQLILEGSTAGRYHVVDRWEPDGPYVKACLLLADLSGVNMRKAIESYHHAGSPK